MTDGPSERELELESISGDAESQFDQGTGRDVNSIDETSKKIAGGDYKSHPVYNGDSTDYQGDTSANTVAV